MKLTRDALVLGVLILLLVILNVTSLVANRNAEVSRDYLDGLMRSTGVCTLRSSGAVNTEEIPYTPQAIEDYYNACLQERIQ